MSMGRVAVLPVQRQPEPLTHPEWCIRNGCEADEYGRGMHAAEPLHAEYRDQQVTVSACQEFESIGGVWADSEPMFAISVRSLALNVPAFTVYLDDRGCQRLADALRCVRFQVDVCR